MSLKENIAKLYCANYCEARVGCPYTEESVQSECDHYYELTVQILDLIEQEAKEKGWLRIECCPEYYTGNCDVSNPNCDKYTEDCERTLSVTRQDLEG